tara:strand:+ start:406 stop:714 length:309 start_codon:yes stop_codon:yes gene_type:complete
VPAVWISLAIQTFSLKQVKLYSSLVVLTRPTPDIKKTKPRIPYVTSDFIFILSSGEFTNRIAAYIIPTIPSIVKIAPKMRFKFMINELCYVANTVAIDRNIF